MKKILIQAGHQGRTTGATGAPGEQKWTGEIVPQIAKKLRDKGFEVKEINADPSSGDIAGDWDLFLSVHYDSDSYNDRGGFIDTPDPSVDFATKESNRIAEEMRKVYFDRTGIPNHPERSNKNTKYYYMWSRMSAKTPCVIIEAGVGWRTPEDHKTLHFEQDRVAGAIADGIINALGDQTPVDPCSEYKKKAQRYDDFVKIGFSSVSDVKELQLANERLENENQKLFKIIKNSPIIPMDSDSAELIKGNTVKYTTKDGKRVSINYAIDS